MLNAIHRHLSSGRYVLGALLWLGSVSAAVAADVAANASAPLPTYDRVLQRTPPRPIEDFTLTDQDGRAFHFSSLRGQPVLVFFGFAHCPDVCPAALAKLQMLKASHRELANLAVVMVSVDADRDTPAALKAYLANFKSGFTGLTGDPATIREIAQRFSAPYFKGQARPSGDYLVQHTSQVYVVDKNGNLRAEFYDASLDAM